MFPIATGLIEPRTPGGRPALWAATGRSGGVSLPPYASLNLAGHVGDEQEAVAANRGRLAHVLGAAAHRVVVMDCVHGAAVAEVDRPGVISGVDGLITSEPDLVIVALGADCVPMALVGADGRTIAVAHCGWRGLVVGIVDAVVEGLRAHRTEIGQAILGPAVCGTCYPVPTDRAAELTASCSTAVAAAALVTCPDGQPGIDVREGVRARLRDLGVEARRIRTAGGCTVEDPDLFSFRRDGVTGRQGIGLRLDNVARMGV
jgi:YfiH family protein